MARSALFNPRAHTHPASCHRHSAAHAHHAATYRHRHHASTHDHLSACTRFLCVCLVLAAVFVAPACAQSPTADASCHIVWGVDLECGAASLANPLAVADEFQCSVVDAVDWSAMDCLPYNHTADIDGQLLYPTLPWSLLECHTPVNSSADMVMQYVCQAPPAANECNSSGVDDYSLGLGIGAIFIILFASLLGTAIPLVGKHFPRLIPFPFLFILAKHVGTGVLLALGFIHLLTPGLEQLENECLPAGWLEYPYALLFAMLAAIAMHLTETLLHLVAGANAVHSHSTHAHGGHGPLDKTAAGDHAHGHSHGHSHGAKKPKDGTTETSESPAFVAAAAAAEPAAHTDPETGAVPAASGADDSGSDKRSSDDVALLSKRQRAIRYLNARLTRSDVTISAFLLEFGLSTHSVIVGITLGVSTYSEMRVLVPALVFHQFFEGFALGARLAESKLSSWVELVLTAIYSVAASIGIIIGIGIRHSYNPNGVTANLVQGTFDSVSAGLILYVAFCHMMGEDFAHDTAAAKSWWRVLLIILAYLFGVGVMCMIGHWL